MQLVHQIEPLVLEAQQITEEIPLIPCVHIHCNNCARNWINYTEFFERDVGAVRTSCKRAINVVSSERTYKQRNAVFYNMVRAYHSHSTSVERS